METTNKHATILTGRVGGTALLQLDVGGMTPVISKMVPVQDLDQLQDEVALEFARRLRQEGICVINLYSLDSTHLVGSDGIYKTTNPNALGGLYLESFQKRVIERMRRIAA